MTKSLGTILDDAKRRPAGLGTGMRPSNAATTSLGLATAALWAAVLLSAAGAVYCKFSARQLFIQLEQLSTQRDNLDIQWGQLQLEQSAWSTHAFVESVAGNKLHMTMPPPKDIVIIGQAPEQ
jgi:cell division protein FtsL